MKFFAVFLFVAVAVSVVSAKRKRLDEEENVHDLWEDHIENHDLEFESEDHHDELQELFVAKDEMIEEHNSQDHPYVLVHNEFSHLSDEDLSKYLGHKKNENATYRGLPFSMEAFNLDRVTIPAKLDLRSDPCNGPIKDQSKPNDCGSCWAFSAVACVEFGRCKNNGNQYVSLSEQQLVDCDSGNKGCDGGWSPDAWKYLMNNGGSDTAASYPYTAKAGSCNAKQATVGAQVASFTIIPKGQGTVEAMKSAIVQYGTIGASINVVSSFMHFASGVYTSKDCDTADGTTTNHAINIVGWDVDPATQIEYWIVRNSWGTGDQDNPKGFNGYYYIQAGVNKCNIESEPIFVVVK